MKNFLFSIIILAFCVVITLAAFEVFLRISAGDDKTHAKIFDYVLTDTHWHLQPNSDNDFYNDKKQHIVIQADENGYRNPAATIETSDILFLGDSNAISANTYEDETLVGQFRQKGLKVYNGGMNGTGFYHQFFIMKGLLEKHHFKYVVLLSMSGNDFSDNYFYNKNIKKSVQNFSASEEKDIGDFDKKIQANKASLKSVLYGVCKKSKACFSLYQHVWLGEVKGYNSNPLKDSEYFYLHMLDTNDNEISKQAVSDTKEALKAMKGLAESHGAKLVVLQAPNQKQGIHTRTMLLTNPSAATNLHYRTLIQDMYIEGRIDMDRPSNILASLCDDLGIPHKSVINEVHKAPDPQEFYGLFDGHWNAKGQGFAATIYAPWLKEQMR